MLIYVNHTGNRIEYVCEFIFTQFFGLGFTLESNKDTFEAYQGPKLAYSEEEIIAMVQIFPAGLLWETGTGNINIETIHYREICCPFATNRGIVPFDLFSAVFFFLSRFEEYQPFTPNKYEQFPAVNSFAYKNNLLIKPVVDIWLHDLKRLLLKTYPNLRFANREFKPVFTYDVDTAFKYKGKNRLRNLAGWCVDALQMRFVQIKERVGVLFHNDHDDYDTYAHIRTCAIKYQYTPVLFFLTGKRNKFNKNINPHTRVFYELLSSVKEFAAIGVHPSYYAYNDLQLLQTEKNLLGKLVAQPILLSRQHYLRLKLPETYNNLLAAGIQEDFTMGFAEQPGFRAGTCTSFYFFDLKKNKTTQLLLHPVAFMEGSFAEDLQLPPATALEEMSGILQEIKNVKGEFYSIWHNHTICDKGFWRGWKQVHDSIIHQALKND